MIIYGVAALAACHLAGVILGGPIAIIAGVGATIACVALVPVVARIGGQDAPLPPLMAQEV